MHPRCLHFPRSLLVLVFSLYAAADLPLAGGTVEAKDGTTLITVVVPSLPKPYDTSTGNRAEVAVIEAFEKDFQETFRCKYLEKYRKDPALNYIDV